VTPEEARAAFPVLERTAYLNAGAFGPLARSTLDAVAARQRRDLEQGRSGSIYTDELKALRAELRMRLASILGVDVRQVALARSTSDACQVILAGLRLGPHDEVVTTEGEHFGLLGPLHASGARVVVASPDRESIRAAIGRHTRLLALSAVLWTTGDVLPLRALKDETGLPMLVDGAQSVGALHVDASPFDFYTVSGQKWLCGPDATGALYVRDPEALDVALPSYFSQLAFRPDGSFDPAEGAARFDSGWIPPSSLAGLLAALDGAPDWRFERTRALAARCREALGERYDVVTGDAHAGLVSFRPNGEAAADAVARLYERGVVVREIPDRGLVRASCGYWTSEDDLERLIAGLEG
jgi:L-cysteine/cystine lyase